MEAQKRAEEQLEEQQRTQRQAEARQRAAARNGENAVSGAAVGPPMAVSRLNVPKYSGLSAIGWIIIFVGIIDICIVVVVALFLIVGAIAAANDFNSRGTAGAFALAGLGSIPLVISGILSGVVLIGIGNAIHAYRDIAMNSFNLTNAVLQLAQAKTE